MILKQKSFNKKNCTNDETKGKPRKKVPHRGIEQARITKTQYARSGTVQRLNHSATLGNNDEKFVKLSKNAFLKQNSFMRIDEIQYYFSFFL